MLLSRGVSPMAPLRKGGLAVRWSLIALSLYFGVLPAAAQEQVGPSSCQQRRSLLDPLPRACLDPIETDRPHLTDTAHTVDPGHFLLETELVAYAGSRQGEQARPRTLGAMLMLAKLGLLTGVDLQLGYDAFSLSWANGSHDLSAGDELFLRLKVNLFGGNHGRMSLTVAPVFQVSLRGDGLDAGGIALFGADLPAELELELNLSLLSQRDSGGANRFTVIPALALTRELLPRLALFGEVYAETWRARGETQWLGIFASGLLYQLAHDWQLDGGVRVGLNDRAPPYELFLGLSFRI